MGLIGAFFPFGAATQLSEHNGAFLWFNLRNIFNVIALVMYILMVILLGVLIVVGVLTFGFALIFIWAPFLIWLPLDLIALILGIPGTLFHIMSCKDDEGIGSAFTTFGISVVGVCVISFYGFIIHLISWALLVTTGIGFFTIVVAYIISLVCLVLGFLAAKAEA